MEKSNRPLTVAQVAARFKVDGRTIRRWIQRGHFPGAYQLGTGKTPYVIPLEDVLAYEKKLADAPGGAKAS
jgi:excisionase family DNA binding protein